MGYEVQPSIRGIKPRFWLSIFMSESKLLQLQQMGFAFP
jgi:hypothetical protein